MIHEEIRDPKEARRLVAQGLWLQRAAMPRAEWVGPTLGWALEVASQGGPMPPVGIVADVGRRLLEPRWSGTAGPAGSIEVPGWPSGLARGYEDVVLGRLDVDPSFARASDALARYKGRDFDRGVAFVVARLMERSKAGGLVLNPAALKLEPGRTVGQLLADGWESLERDGPSPLLLDLYEDWIAASRDLADALGPEDVFELEHGTALASFGQRIALRQVLESAAEFEAHAPGERPRPSNRRQDVSTRFVDEDAYPVGGFSSISTRGSIESLLHSQLVYMEKDERPDPFDIKFVRDELLYYSRDENQFFRRRRSFLFVLEPDLGRARVKDSGLPRQRIVQVLGMIVAAVRKLTGWLGDDSLAFDVLFVDDPADGASPLAQERELLELILSEAIAGGIATVAPIDRRGLAERVQARGRRSLCHVLKVSTKYRKFDSEFATVADLVVDGPVPTLRLADDRTGDVDEDDGPASAAEAWFARSSRLLEAWI